MEDLDNIIRYHNSVAAEIFWPRSFAMSISGYYSQPILQMHLRRLVIPHQVLEADEQHASH